MSDRLKEIEHIVVLMMENRSFDNMLGYLSYKGGRGDVDGLTGNERNLHEDREYEPRPMSEYTTEADPCHYWHCVEAQLHNNNGGFVENYAKEEPGRPGIVMHYYNAEQVPVYDHLAREFCVLDRWFSSLPGPTQPNRAYALAGTSDGRRDNFTELELASFKGFEAKTIFEVLSEHGVDWHCFSHDISTLRFFKKYRTRLEERIDKVDVFYGLAAQGRLPGVCWIDPDFGLGYYPGSPNDDHPPNDIRHGQNLVSDVYNALLKGNNNLWSKTLFIVTYDEHGGFYDHVRPGQWTPADDLDDMKRYGVRVPAIVASPWVGRGVAYGSRQGDSQDNKFIFDHTSILKTILRRFCTPEGGGPPAMTARVDAANDLGPLLTEGRPRTDFSPAPRLEDVPVKWIDKFRAAEEGSDLQKELAEIAQQAERHQVPPEKL